MIIRKLFLKLWSSAEELNYKNILSLCHKNVDRMLDIGIGDCKWTKRLIDYIKPKECWGIEIVDEWIQKGEKLGIKVKKANIEEGLPLPNDYFDLVHANQVIEHLCNVDLFMKEIYRILRPGGSNYFYRKC